MKFISLTGALVEKQEIVRDGLFLLDTYSVEGKSESTISLSNQPWIFCD